MLRVFAPWRLCVKEFKGINPAQTFVRTLSKPKIDTRAAHLSPLRTMSKLPFELLLALRYLRPERTSV